MSAGTSAVIPVTDQNFRAEVEQQTGVVVVDFGAEWCGPCRMVAPIVEQVAQAFHGRAVVGKLDVDASPAAAARFDVRNLPTFIFFKDGQPVDRVIGAVPRQVLEQRIERYL